MKTLTHRIVLTLLLILMVPAVGAGPVFTGDSETVAVDGHDVVAYFTEGEAMPGSPEYSHHWQGVEWHFANEDHLALFREDPERYAPAFGGHCAFGVANGKKLASSPDYWVIHDGRLYLNLNEDVHGSWTEDLESNIQAADRHWPDQVD